MCSTAKIFVILGFCLIITERSFTFKTQKNCVPPLGNSCIAIRECQFFVNLLDNSPTPRSKQVIKIIRDHHCGFESDTPKVCCFMTTKSTDAKEGSSTPLLDHRSLLPSENCGIINDAFRIINGHKTVIYEFPWMALIAYELNDGIDLGCGGTLITDRYVLTAAHCVVNLTIAWVRLGEHNIETIQDCNFVKDICAPPTQDINVEKTIIYPDYIASLHKNDIALLYLANKANFRQANIQPICLPLGENAKLQLDNRLAVISGWGITDSGFKSMELLKTYIPVIPNENCREVYKKRSVISASQICAGGFMGRDSCGGDSGGPLASIGKVNGTSRYIQYGIVSFGPKYCGADGQPGVYTRVTYYMKWILDNIGANVVDEIP